MFWLGGKPKQIDLIHHFLAETELSVDQLKNDQVYFSSLGRVYYSRKAMETGAARLVMAGVFWYSSFTS